MVDASVIHCVLIVPNELGSIYDWSRAQQIFDGYIRIIRDYMRRETGGDKQWNYETHLRISSRSSFELATDHETSFQIPGTDNYGHMWGDNLFVNWAHGCSMFHNFGLSGQGFHPFVIADEIRETIGFNPMGGPSHGRAMAVVINGGGWYGGGNSWSDIDDPAPSNDIGFAFCGDNEFLQWLPDLPFQVTPGLYRGVSVRPAESCCEYYQSRSRCEGDGIHGVSHEMMHMFGVDCHRESDPGNAMGYDDAWLPLQVAQFHHKNKFFLTDADPTPVSVHLVTGFISMSVGDASTFLPMLTFSDGSVRQATKEEVDLSSVDPGVLDVNANSLFQAKSKGSTWAVATIYDSVPTAPNARRRMSVRAVVV